MTDETAGEALFALRLWPRSMTGLAMRDEIPPSALDLATRIEPHMKRQIVLVGGAEAENHLVYRADISGVVAAGIPQDEFEQQGSGSIQGRVHPEAVPGGIGCWKTRLDVGPQIEPVNGGFYCG